MTALRVLASAGVILGAIDVIAVGIGAYVYLGRRGARRAEARARARQAARNRHPAFRRSESDSPVSVAAAADGPGEDDLLAAFAFSPRAVRRMRRLARRVERLGGQL